LKIEGRDITKVCESLKREKDGDDRHHLFLYFSATYLIF